MPRDPLPRRQDLVEASLDGTDQDTYPYGITTAKSVI